MTLPRLLHMRAASRTLALVTILTLVPLLAWDASPQAFPARAHDALAAIPLALIAVACLVHPIVRRAHGLEVARPVYSPRPSCSGRPTRGYLRGIAGLRALGRPEKAADTPPSTTRWTVPWTNRTPSKSPSRRRWRKPRQPVGTTWSFSWLEGSRRGLFVKPHDRARRNDLAVAVRLAAEAGEWAVVATLSRQLDALRREREGGGLKVIKGGSGASGYWGAMSAGWRPSPCLRPMALVPSWAGQRRLSALAGAGCSTTATRSRCSGRCPTRASTRSSPIPPYSSGGFTRGDRSLPPAMKYTMNGTKIEYPAFSGDNRDQRSFAYCPARARTARC